MAGLLSGMGVLKDVFRRMPGRLRSQLGLSFAGAVAVSLSQIAVVGAVALLATALSSPDSLGVSGRMATVRALLPSIVFADPRNVVIFFAAATGGAVLCNNVLKAVYAYWAARVSRQVEHYYATQLLDVLIRAPYEWHTSRKKSDVIAVLAWTTYYGAATSNVILLLCDGLSLALVAAAVVAVDPVVGGFGLLLISLAGYGLALGSRRWLDASAERQRAWTVGRSRTSHMALMGVRDIKLFGREAPVVERYSGQMLDGVGVNAKLEFIRPLPAYALETLGLVGISAAVIVMALRGASTAYMAGTMALVAAAGWRLLPSVGKMLNSMTMIRVSLPYLRQVEEWQAEVCVRAVPADPGGGEPEGGFARELVLSGISFGYQGCDRMALSGVDLRIDRGAVVGIVGGSGSGKSTLMDVLCGLLSPSAGRMEIDGRAMDEREARSWQVKSVGYVSQAPFIFNGTLAENIAFSLDEKEIDRERVLHSCEMAAVDFLSDLPQGLDSPIGDAGILLSGGQRQRVAIARALYRDPAVLIFDEATSSLDTRSEASIQETILGLRGSRTLVIVAHRLSTVEACDEVYWIDRGKVRMRGGAAEVLAAYREFLTEHPAEAETVSAVA